MCISSTIFFALASRKQPVDSRGAASFVLGRAMPGSPYHVTGLNMAENKTSGTG